MPPDTEAKHVVVPVRLTEDMAYALSERNDPVRANEDWRNKYRRMYAAMLAAAPQGTHVAVPKELIERILQGPMTWGDDRLAELIRVVAIFCLHFMEQ